MRWIVFIVVTICLFVSCKKYERTNPLDGIAGVKTGAVNQLSLSSIEITSTLSEIKGVQQVTQRGVCWSTSTSPTTSDDFVAQGSGFGTFTTQITTLEANKMYYFRAFASNEKTTVYGNEVSFNTVGPNIKTTLASLITFNGATIGGILMDDKGYNVLEKGIIWGESLNLGYDNTRLQADQNPFEFQITSLQKDKTYYYRAYVKTNLGIAYGEEFSFVVRNDSGIIIKGVEFIDIPAGTYTMGSPSIEVGRNSDEEQHQVTLSAFKMSKNEITFAQYDAFCDATGRVKPVDFFGLGRGNMPVVDVSWYDAVAFADWMGCRLPTEAEWEYACRAGTTTAFNTGANLTNNQANYEGTKPYGGNINGKIYPVGSFPSNAWGLNDMHGNVSERCSDFYGKYDIESKINPTGPPTGEYHVYRGGSWDNTVEGCRSSLRYGGGPWGGSLGIGIRLVYP